MYLLLLPIVFAIFVSQFVIFVSLFVNFVSLFGILVSLFVTFVSLFPVLISLELIQNGEQGVEQQQLLSPCHSPPSLDLECAGPLWF